MACWTKQRVSSYGTYPFSQEQIAKSCSTYFLPNFINSKPSRYKYLNYIFGCKATSKT